ncbi:upstream activation factor subunit spp27-like isoform X2 [Branchiostoma floridae]|uniref:Upstream activation factor subunit spp27-like isoform X2 n=1 Tax=Branchiostoma floridae TaxID=7739 RepID=A0A9J7KX62_BRAFL|nr:upstream activation factor subunit spp27-like isoform X2 [Branchiostoma floridae]
MADISEGQIRESIAEILKHGDLTTLTSKSVRKMLENKFEVELTERKKEIDNMLMAMIEAKQEEENQNGQHSNSDSSDDSFAPEPPKKKAKTSAKSSSKKKTSSKKPVAKTKASKSSRKTVDDSSDENSDGVDDEKLARKLHAEENRTSMRAVKKIPAKRKRKKKKDSDDDSDDDFEEKPKRKNSMYSRDMVLSPDLAAVVGGEKMPRSEVVKRMWAVIKERKLQDPSDKQYIICDEQLLKVFGERRLKPFGMMKYLKNHIMDPKAM